MNHTYFAVYRQKRKSKRIDEIMGKKRAKSKDNLTKIYNLNYYKSWQEVVKVGFNTMAVADSRNFWYKIGQIRP